MQCMQHRGGVHRTSQASPVQAVPSSTTNECLRCAPPPYATFPVPNEPWKQRFPAAIANPHSSAAVRTIHAEKRPASLGPTCLERYQSLPRYSSPSLEKQQCTHVTTCSQATHLDRLRTNLRRTP